MNVTAKGLPVHETERDRDTLARAFDVQHRAGLVGFDWSEPGGALEKVREETEEVATLIGGSGVGAGGRAGASPLPAAGTGQGSEAADGKGGNPAAAAATESGGGRESEVAEEVGDLLFAVVNLARLAGVDPVAALSRAMAKFERRFAEVRRLAAARGLPMPGTPLEPLDRLWDEVKGRGDGPGNP